MIQMQLESPCIMILLVVVISMHYVVHCFPLESQVDDDDNLTLPLILTPYIKSGRLDAGRNAAEVTPLLGNIQSYSGYFTVNETYNKNLFFWYFPAEEQLNANETSPVILWLQGGPGVSSMYGLFYENGPMMFREGVLAERPYRWSKTNHVIYMDNPAGTGFSTSDPEGYVKNEEEVGADLYQALEQFFQLFPQLLENDFFAAGESYAGKYVPAIAYRIHQKNPTSSVRINLKGVAIGDGMLDPQFLLYGEYLAEHGLIGLDDLHQVLDEERQYLDAIREGNTNSIDIPIPIISLGYKMRDAGISVYNYLKSWDHHLCESDVEMFLGRSDVRQQLHVGDNKFQCDNIDIRQTLFPEDYFSPTSPYLEELLEDYRVLFYNGQLDVIITYMMTQRFADHLKWSGSKEYHAAKRTTWHVEEDLAGFIKSGGNLTVVLVNNAGHMVPMDQPKFGFDLINKFVRNQPYLY